jgi:hypothetical protein
MMNKVRFVMNKARNNRLAVNRARAVALRTFLTITLGLFSLLTLTGCVPLLIGFFNLIWASIPSLIPIIGSLAGAAAGVISLISLFGDDSATDSMMYGGGASGLWPDGSTGGGFNDDDTFDDGGSLIGDFVGGVLGIPGGLSGSGAGILGLLAVLLLSRRKQ